MSAQGVDFAYVTSSCARPVTCSQSHVFSHMFLVTCSQSHVRASAADANNTNQPTFIASPQARWPAVVSCLLLLRDKSIDSKRQHPHQVRNLSVHAFASSSSSSSIKPIESPAFLTQGYAMHPTRSLVSNTAISSSTNPHPIFQHASQTMYHLEIKPNLLAVCIQRSLDKALELHAPSRFILTLFDAH